MTRSPYCLPMQRGSSCFMPFDEKRNSLWCAKIACAICDDRQPLGAQRNVTKSRAAEECPQHCAAARTSCVPLSRHARRKVEHIRADSKVSQSWSYRAGALRTENVDETIRRYAR